MWVRALEDFYFDFDVNGSYSVPFGTRLLTKDRWYRVVRDNRKSEGMVSVITDYDDDPRWFFCNRYFSADSIEKWREEQIGKILD